MSELNKFGLFMEMVRRNDGVTKLRSKHSQFGVKTAPVDNPSRYTHRAWKKNKQDFECYVCEKKDRPKCLGAGCFSTNSCRHVFCIDCIMFMGLMDVKTCPICDDDWSKYLIVGDIVCKAYGVKDFSEVKDRSEIKDAIGLDDFEKLNRYLQE